MRRMALTLKSSANLRSGSLPMSTPWVPSLQFIFSLSQGICRTKFPTDQWIEAVRWHGDTKIAAIVRTAAEWEDAKTLLARLENVVVEAESKQGAVVWSSAQNNPPAIPTDSFPLQLVVLTEMRSNDISLKPCKWKLLDSGVGISRILSPGISRSGRIKKGSRSTDLRLLLWRTRLLLLAPLEALKPCRSLR